MRSDFRLRKSWATYLVSPSTRTVPCRQVIAEKYRRFQPLTNQIGFIQKKYEERKRFANVMDFDDLLVKTVQVLQQNSAIAEFYQRHFQFILVDEYQDTNKLQSELIDLLAIRHQSVMVVGDDAQSIYSWRGANYQNILDFPRRYPNARIYRIETNYRSVPEILALANAAILANTKQFSKTLRAHRDGSEIRPALVSLYDTNQQAAFVAQRILELREEGVDLGQHGCSVSRSFPILGGTACVDSIRDSFLDYERASIFRTSPHQGRRGVHEVCHQPCGRSRFQAHGAPPSGCRSQDGRETLGAALFGAG